MIHLNPILPGLIPNRIKEHINRTLLILLDLTIQHRNPKNHALLPCAKDSLFASQLSLPIEVWRVGRGVGLVRSCAGFPVENVVRGYVDQDYITVRTFLGEAVRRLNLDCSCMDAQMSYLEQI